MKPILLLILMTLLSHFVYAQEMARIVRWKSPVTGDFETLREDFNTDAQLQSWGYQNKIYQFSAYKTRPNDPNATAVNRWVMPNCAASIVIAEHEIPDATLLSWGYKSKQFLFFAYRNKPATGDFVAVNRWINAKPQGDKCRDFTLTVAETEFTDAQLISSGYKDKKTQFWVPRPESGLLVAKKPSIFPNESVRTSVGRENQQRPEQYSNVREEEKNGEFCTTRKVDLQESNFERIITGGILDKVFPGALYMASSIGDGSFVPYTANPRLPLQLRIDLYGARSQGSTITTVNTPVSFGQIQDGVLTLIRQHGSNSNPARLTYAVRKIDAEEELKIFVGGSYSGFGVSVQASFDYRNKRKKNVVLARATQAYFSVNVDNDATLVERQANTNNDAAYLSSVTYGRIGYLRIETDESEETIKAALTGSYSGAAVEARVESERILRESTITGFFLGGDATSAARTIGGYEDFKNWLVSGARYRSNTAPVPISYKLRYLRDQRDAFVTMTTSYTERNCEKAKYLEVALLGITSDIRQNGMCGTIKIEALELQDGTVNLVKRQVFPEGEPDGTTIIWNTDRAHGVPPIGWKQGGVPPGNIRKSWYFYFDPRKVGRGEVKLRLTMKIDAWHKDNEFSVEGWHGMGREEVREFRLQDALNGNDKIDAKNYLVLGPFRSHSRSDREHEFRAIFEVKPLK